MKKNPLKELTDEELKDYAFSRKKNFSKTTVANRIIEDYGMWLPTYNQLVTFVFSNQEVIYTSNDIDGNKTFGEVADILLEQELELRK